jgi:hypothetical protein
MNDPFSNYPKTGIERNPYAAEAPVDMFALPAAQGDGYIKQIPIIGTLTLVQGILELLVAGVLLFITLSIAFAINSGAEIKELNNSNASPEAVMIGYGIVAFLVGLSATLRLIGGTMTLFRRGRMLTIVSSVVGLTTVFTGCCSITSLGLAVYTLIVMVQPSVIQEYAKFKGPRI